jgi:hypothetical protein
MGRDRDYFARVRDYGLRLLAAKAWCCRQRLGAQTVWQIVTVCFFYPLAPVSSRPQNSAGTASAVGRLMFA